MISLQCSNGGIAQAMISSQRSEETVTAWLGVLEAGDETASGNKIEALSCPLLPHMTLTSPVQEAANVGDLVYASVKLIAKLLWAPGATLS